VNRKDRLKILRKIANEEKVDEAPSDDNNAGEAYADKFILEALRRVNIPGLEDN